MDSMPIHGGAAASDETAGDTPRWYEPDLGGTYVGLGNDRPGGGGELKQGLDPGLAVVRFVYDGMRIDREWSTRHARGFTWWGHRLATRVWSEHGVDEDGIEIFRLVARTTLLRDVADGSLAASALEVGNRLAVTSALVADPEAKTIDYVASMWVHEQTLDWVAKMFSMVVAMQAAQAHVQAEKLAPALMAKVAFSDHPDLGQRPEPDDMLGLILLVASAGQEASAWAGPQMTKGLELVRGLPVVQRAVGDESSIVLDLRSGDQTGQVQISALAPHPSLGSGLLVRSSFDAGGKIGPDWAGSMNRREIESIVAAMFLGSWVGSAEPPTFVTFYPSYYTQTGVGVVNIVISAINRAMWAAKLDGATSA